MDIKERLNLYKKALKDYNYSLKKQTKWYGIFIDNKYTNFGFCYYFSETHNLNLYLDENRFKLLLPELYATKPVNKPVNLNSSHWFGCGELEPRIACLQKAIKLCENKIAIKKYLYI